MLLQEGLFARWEEEGSETSDQYQVGDSATLRYAHAILTLFLAAVRPDKTVQHWVQGREQEQVSDSV